MLLLLASTGSLLVVNLICACVALAVGFAAGVWFFGANDESTAGTSKGKTALDPETVLANERSVMASSRLKDLASSIASDVHSHSGVVSELTEALNTIGSEDKSVDVAVFEAISNMVEANGHLQERLEQAEQQIEAQAEQIQSHETEARTDSLTKLSNRRAFDTELSRRYAEWERKGTPLSLIILDIDHFKKFNDTHGHQAGDEVLRHVGKKLIEATRTMDLPCRYGGEEFAIVMPTTFAKDGIVVAERVRTSIEDSAIEFEGKVLKVTTSVGLAEIESEDDIKRILKRADDALYKSKEEGRNCGHMHANNECVPITPGKSTSEPEKQESNKAIAAPKTEVLDNLPEHQVMLEELARRVAESHRFGVPLAVMYLEVNQFQDIQKRFGPVAAKLTLNSVAQFINTTLRDMDLLARSGDGSFILMLPGSSQQEAFQVGRRIDSSMVNCVIPVGDEKVQLSLRSGVAATDTNDTADSIVSRAMTLMAEKQASEAALK